MPVHMVRDRHSRGVLIERGMNVTYLENANAYSLGSGKMLYPL